MIYTSITNNKDNLIEGVVRVDAPNIFIDPVRNARAPKILSHLYSPGSYSLWVDGNIQLLLKNYDGLIREYLDHCDICVFRHFERTNIYQEAEIIKKLQLDNKKLVNKQMKRYKLEKFSGDGLCESGVILRRHTKEIIELNNLWWAEICFGSKRDQLSLPYCLWKLNIKINFFPGNTRKQFGGSEYFKWHTHNFE